MQYYGTPKYTFQNDFLLIFIGAIVFTASFLWKDFISDIQESIFPKKSGFFGRFLFVLLTTFILISFSVYLKNTFRLASSPNIIRFDDNPINNNSDDSDTD